MDLLLIDVVLRMEIIEISLTMRSASIVDLIMLIYDKYIYIWGWVKTLVPSEPQIAGKWMFIPLKMYL